MRKCFVCVCVCGFGCGCVHCQMICEWWMYLRRCFNPKNDISCVSVVCVCVYCQIICEWCMYMRPCFNPKNDILYLYVYVNLLWYACMYVYVYACSCIMVLHMSFLYVRHWCMLTYHGITSVCMHVCMYVCMYDIVCMYVYVDLSWYYICRLIQLSTHEGSRPSYGTF
jgi:hypothetical protein